MYSVTTELKILLLTYKALNNQAPSYIKELTAQYYQIRSLPKYRLAWLLESVRVQWEASASRLLSCGTSSHSEFRRTLWLQSHSYSYLLSDEELDNSDGSPVRKVKFFQMVKKKPVMIFFIYVMFYRGHVLNFPESL